jgi:predicted ester cyclase
MIAQRTIWPVVAITLLLAAAGSVGPKPSITMERWQIATPDAAATERVARQAIAAVNAALASGDESGIDAWFAPEMVGHPPHRSIATGEAFSHDLAGMKLALAEIRRYFPDATILVEDVIAAGDKAAARVTFRGTPDAAAFGRATVSERPLEAGGVFFGRVVGRRVVEFWAYFDEAELLMLLMATPAP